MRVRKRESGPYAEATSGRGCGARRIPMSARDLLLHAARRGRVARLAAAASVAVSLAVLLLMLAPDRDPATRAVARTRHEGSSAPVPVSYRPRLLALSPPRRSR